MPRTALTFKHQNEVNPQEQSAVVQKQQQQQQQQKCEFTQFI